MKQPHVERSLRPAGEVRVLGEEVRALEAALSDERERNASLEALVASLMGEMLSSEERRARERSLRNSRSSELVHRASVDSAREMLEEGSTALMAAHEHTLRLVEMRMAAMAAQLARCASVLPQRVDVPADDGQLSPQSPTATSLLAKGGNLAFVEEEWAEPNSGGLCLDSLPLHVPSAGSHGATGVTGGAFGIHGRRPAIATLPWSSSPAALGVGWWEEANGVAKPHAPALELLLATAEAEDGASPPDSQPPSPTLTAGHLAADPFASVSSTPGEAEPAAAGGGTAGAGDPVVVSFGPVAVRFHPSVGF